MGFIKGSYVPSVGSSNGVYTIAIGGFLLASGDPASIQLFVGRDYSKDFPISIMTRERKTDWYPKAMK